MRKNRFCVEDYTFWAIFGMIVLTWCYRVWYMISNPLGIWSIVLQVLFAAVLWRILGSASRNLTSIVLIAVYPQVLSEILAFWKYIEPVRLMTAGALFLSAVFCTVIGRRMVHRFAASSGRAYYSGCFRQRARKYFVSISCLLLAAAAVYGRAARIENWSVMMREIMSIYHEIDAEENNDVNCLASNIETVSRLDPKGGWKKLGLEEKSEVLETIIRIECRYLGMEDVYPKLNIAYTEQDEVLGYYDRENDIITISYMYLCDMNASGYSVCQVLCHELYHRVQFYQVSMLEALESSEDTRKYADLLLLHDTSVYRDEADHYYDGRDNYYLYASQQLEEDADHYGDEAAMEYYQAVQEYFKEQEKQA